MLKEIQMYIRILEELKELKELVQKNTPNQILTIRELVEYSRLSQSTIRRSIAKGSLKVIRRGGKFLFQINDVEKWLNK